uniref:HAT C-terminal dimerisation domain-containing protein n=1 Tax=Fagus sylvatica TaxID=28930 RepID=A0A2N9IZ29_FAGSY
MPSIDVDDSGRKRQRQPSSILKDYYLMESKVVAIEDDPANFAKAVKSHDAEQWLKFHQAILDIDYEMSPLDHCVYVWRDKEKLTLLSLYMDNILLASNSLDMMKETKFCLGSKFEMKDMGPANYVLGIRISRDRESKLIYLDQENYLEKVLKSKMEDCRPVSTPVYKGTILNKSMCPINKIELKEMIDVPYAQAVDSLMYAMMSTRPDICYVVGLVSRYQSNPGKAHWQAVKRIFSTTVSNAVWIKRFVDSLKLDMQNRPEVLVKIPPTKPHPPNRAAPPPLATPDAGHLHLQGRPPYRLVRRGDGVLRPPANRTAPIQVSHPQLVSRQPLSLFGSRSLSHLTPPQVLNRFGNFFAPLGPQQVGSQEHPTKQVNSQQYSTLFPILSHVTVAKDCMKLYLNERKKLKDVLSKKGQKGETIGKVVEKCLKEWGIDIVLTITVDNASSNDVAIDYLMRKMKLKERCIVGCEFLHMRCCAHILNLIVQDGLKDIHDSIAKVRNAVRYAKSSPKRFEEFLEAVKDANIQSKSLLSLDVPTRWNFTYLMLEAAEKFERAFDRLIIDDEQYMDYFEELDGNGKKPKGPPRSLDWENARLISVVLDPRYKIKYIVYWFNKWYAKPKAESMVEKVRGAIDRLYAHYATEFETASSSATVSASGSGSCVTSDVASSSMSSASDTHDPWKSTVEEFQHHLAQEDNGECKTEVDQYLSEAIPVSTVASESAFSTGGRVLDSFRSSLSPLTVEALICCQNWLRSTSSPVKLREAMDEVQSIDEELESVGSLGVGD